MRAAGCVLVATAVGPAVALSYVSLAWADVAAPAAAPLGAYVPCAHITRAAHHPRDHAPPRIRPLKRDLTVVAATTSIVNTGSTADALRELRSVRASGFSTGDLAGFASMYPREQCVASDGAGTPKQ